MTTQFEIEPGYEKALQDAGLASLDALMHAKADGTAGKHAHRETVPLTISIDGVARKFFLKRVFKVPPKHGIFPLLRGRAGHAQPYLEWHMLGLLKAAGIPAMKRVAFGEERRFNIPRRACLLVEAVPMPHTLEDWLVPGFPRPQAVTHRMCSRLFYETGLLIGRLHATGFRWPDLQAKHVFAAPAPAGSSHAWNFSLIDVERMTTTECRLKSPNGKDWPRELYRFPKSLSPLAVTTEDYCRFMAGYSRYAFAHIDRDYRKARREFYLIGKTSAVDSPFVTARRQPRLPDDHEHPRTMQLTRFKKARADQRALPMLTREGLTNLADVFQYRRDDQLSKPGLSSHRHRQRITVSNGDGRPHVMYLKRYDHPPMGEQFRRIRETKLGLSTAAREMRFVKKLHEIGVPTMRMVAFGQEMRGLWEKRSFALTEEIPGESLEKLAARAVSNPTSVPSWHDRRELVRQLALVVRQLHTHELFHRDLYLAHVFLTRNADNAIVLHVIDLARMLEKPRNKERWMVKDLAALDHSAPQGLVTRNDRIRFLHNYIPSISKADSKSARHQKIRYHITMVQKRVARMRTHDSHRSARFAQSRPS